MDEPTFDTEEITGDQTPSFYIDPVTSKQLPSDITQGSTISYISTLTGNEYERSTLATIELAKRNPNLTYGEVMEMAKDPEILNPIETQLEADSHHTYLVEEEIIPTRKTNPDSVNTEADAETFFKEKLAFLKEKYDFTPYNGIMQISNNELVAIENIYIGGGSDTSAFKNIDGSGIYGDLGDNPTYFTSDFEVACSHMQESQPILIEIDTKKLLDLRKTYRDPESFYIQDESGKTFITFNGIPIEAIKRILVLKKLK